MMRCKALMIIFLLDRSKCVFFRDLLMIFLVTKNEITYTKIAIMLSNS